MAGDHSAGDPAWPNRRVPVLFAFSLLAAVCGTLFSGALGASPAAKLFAVLIAGAVPVLVSLARLRRLRVSLALLLVAGALAVTYGAFTSLDFASEREATFPIPPALPDPQPTGDGRARLDRDGDGAPRPVDCDDGDPSTYPGAIDNYGDAVDQNCDGAATLDPDEDRDGVEVPVDCNDQDPGVYPGAPEYPRDGVDQDCDGADAVRGRRGYPNPTEP